MLMLRYYVNVDYVPNGAGPCSNPGAQTIQVFGDDQFASYPGAPNAGVVVPGGDSPSSANLAAAVTTMSAQITTQLQAIQARIAQFGSGQG